MNLFNHKQETGVGGTMQSWKRIPKVYREEAGSVSHAPDQHAHASLLFNADYTKPGGKVHGPDDRMRI